MTQNLWDAAIAVLRGKFISNLTPKGTRERRTNKTQSQKKERNHKDQSGNKGNRNKENNSKDQ